MNKFLRCFAQFFLVFVLVSCATTEKLDYFKENRNIVPETFEWTDITESGTIQSCTVCIPESKLIYHLIKIDLNDKNLKIEPVINSTENNYKSVDLQKFAETKTVVINTSPFIIPSSFGRFLAGKTTRYYNLGLHKDDGTVLSESIDRYAALLLKKDTDGSFIARTVQSQTDKMVEEWLYAFGGFFLCLKDYEVQDYLEYNYDSRTMAGLSEDGKTLVLLVAEGETNASLGLSFPECGRIFLALGLKDGIGFDGGSSSVLYIRGKNFLSYKKARGHSSGLAFSQQ